MFHYYVVDGVTVFDGKILSFKNELQTSSFVRTCKFPSPRKNVQYLLTISQFKRLKQILSNLYDANVFITEKLKRNSLYSFKLHQDRTFKSIH